MGWKLVSVAEMKAIETEANAAGVSYQAMMEAAGKGLAETVIAHSHNQSARVIGLVGSGNNGGDTLIALDHLAQCGFSCRAYLTRERTEGEGLTQRLVDDGGEALVQAQDPHGDQLRQWLEGTDILLDGLLGTGIRLPLNEQIGSILDAAGAELARRPGRLQVVAVDCPSGVDCDSGEMDERVLPAEVTVCMEAVKTGLLKLPAFSRVGELTVVPIGLPEDFPAAQKIHQKVADAGWVHDRLPRRPLDAHKGTFGTAMVAAGSVNYCGAALLAGKAAYRVGAGLVTLAVPGSIHSALAGQFLEATWVLLPNEMGSISAPAAKVLEQNLGRATALLLGPGWGTEETTQEFMADLLAPAKAQNQHPVGLLPVERETPQASSQPLPPLVIDADGLRALAKIEDWPQIIPANTILTPHPGEMEALTGMPVKEIQADRMAVAIDYAARWNCVVVLKGAFTVIANPQGEAVTIPVATPALARAGSGDVLAGMITGLLAQRIPAMDAAVAGAWLHGQCGLAAERVLGGSASVLAGDILAQIPAVLAALN